MGKYNRVIAFFIVLYILAMLAEQAYLFIQLRQMEGTPVVTPNVYGQVRFCVNHPPTLNNSCNFTGRQDLPYTCIVNGSDPDGQYFVFHSDFPLKPNLFNISPTGLINFTPNSSYVGNHSFLLGLYDNSGCDNNDHTELFNFLVTNVNDPPILVKNIPDQTWQVGTSITPFDLDNYFFDPDNDPMQYTTAPDSLPNINVTIDQNNMVTFKSLNGWSGTTTIIFIAWDPYYANGSSNVVKLTVTNNNNQNQNNQNTQSSSSGGGGGGGSSMSYPVCLPEWYCRPWGACEPDGFMKRDCYDLNTCNTTFGRPNLTEECKFISTCFDGFKGPDEEGIDCGGNCPPCGSCYDNVCNNNEDCLKGITNTPDCGGSCKPCIVPVKETCSDNICNNNEDCMFGKADTPDCGGSCMPCIITEMPKKIVSVNWLLVVMALLMGITSMYTARKVSLYLMDLAAMRKSKIPQLNKEAAKALYESILELEKMLEDGKIEEAILRFSEIVRKYFQLLLRIKYECTYEEIMYEMNKLGLSNSFRNVFMQFFQRSTEIEFSGRKISTPEMFAMVEEFKQIVSFTTAHAFESEPEKKKEKLTTNDKADRLFFMISSAEASIRQRDLNIAYEKYVSILKDFKALEKKDKDKLYSFISRLYEEIKLARELLPQDKQK